MKKIRILAVVVCVLVVANIASADTIRGIDIDFVTIGNAGNSGDTRAAASPYNCGAVAYNYRIGKYEVTNAQWNAFTAAAGAPTGNDGGYGCPTSFDGAQQPTDNISWYEATQFCNYLTSGDKSKGAYQFSGGYFQGINRTAAQASYGKIYVIPTMDEWYKAAYYKPDGSSYSLYANGTDTAPSTSQTCYKIYSSPWNVGTGTQEQNGTYDMMGNFEEWNEEFYSAGRYSGRVVRGGSFSLDEYYLMSSIWEYTPATNEGRSLGFRVAEVPEPATILLLTLGGLALMKKRR